jgi:hypothetical protein
MMIPARRSLRVAMLTVAALVLGVYAPAQAQTSGVQTVFTPTSSAGYVNPGVMYARAVTLQHNGSANGTMLSTFEVYTNSTPYFPVYRSTDGGQKWSYLSRVTDTVNGFGMRWNPQIYELPAALGGLPAGTLLEAGLSVPADRHSTEILLYASTDRGRSWRLLSSVAKGGPAWVDDPNTPIWEPFLLMNNGKLIVYYSDQRQNSVHSQKLVHQVSTDGAHWRPVVDDAAYPAQSARPGMATVAQIGGGRWIMTYEYCGAPAGSCPVYYRIATDPEKFGTVDDHQLVLNDGTKPCCQPYVVWTPSGGPNGTIVVADGGQTALAVNTAGGDPTAWRSQASNGPGGYSPSLMLMPDGNTVMKLTGGYHDSNYLNQVQFAFDHIAPGISSGATYTLSDGRTTLTSPITRQPDGYFTLKDSQEWSIVQQTDGTFTLTSRRNGDSSPHWTLTQTTLPDLTSGQFTLQNDFGKYLEIPAGSTTAGTQADQWWYANQPWHLWRFVTATGGYRIVNVQSGLALADSGPVTQVPIGDDATQVWTLVPHGTRYLIKNVGTGKVVTIAQGVPTDLAKALSWNEIDTPDQYWTVRRINN